MSNTLPQAGLYLAKLEQRTPFSPGARAAFLQLTAQRRTYAAYRDIVREGDKPAHSCMVETGLVSRYKTLSNGTRQICSFHIAGDMVDLESALVVRSDHGVYTHSATSVLMMDHGEILSLAADYPEVGRALWFDTLIDAAIYREWTVNVGRRNARERAAHLLLEFAVRLRGAGLIDGNEFQLPLSQSDLSDALGISAVHMNRTLQWLRTERLIRTISQTIIIEDREALVALSGFTSNYLHPEGPRRPAAERRLTAPRGDGHARGDEARP